VSKKVFKVEEPPGTYAAKPAAARPGARHTDDATFKRIADRLFTERKELLKKLAQ